VSRKQVPEVAEVEAPPEIASLYADIHAVLSTPVVNLIHRYLATIPDALAYAWSLSRPPLVDGRIDRSVEAMLRAARVDEIPIRRDLDVDGETQARAREIVEIYNRGNRRNIVIYSALETLLRGDVVVDDDFHAPAHAAREDVAAPVRLPTFDELDPTTRALVERLANLQGLEETGIVPSMYLHLALVPGGMEAATAALAPLLQDGTIAAYAQRVRAGALEQARTLVPPPPVALPQSVAERRVEIADVLGGFTARAIPGMIVAGAVMTRAFGGGD
jgi:hypothetical protein